MNKMLFFCITIVSMFFLILGCGTYDEEHGNGFPCYFCGDSSVHSSSSRSSSSIGNSSSSGGVSSSSSNVPQNWCAYPDSRQCIQTTSQTTCQGEGILLTYCPYSSSSGNSSSSIGSYSGEYGSLIYEGKTYKTVVIGTQTWMAENLNLATSSGSVCYDDIDANCTTYGRLYDWATAMNLAASCNSSSCSVNSKHRGICPSDWHIPSTAEWATLENYVGGSSTSARYLKATSGWYDCGPSGSGKSHFCEDTYGFAALPGGDGGTLGYLNGGEFGFWWNASEIDITNADMQYIFYNDEYAYYDNYDKGSFFSVRCLKND